MKHKILYNGEYGRYVGNGNVNYRTKTCVECFARIGNYHKHGCPEAHRDLNQRRHVEEEFSLCELLIIEELSGAKFRGTFWGGYGDPVTYEEQEASAPNPASNR